MDFIEVIITAIPELAEWMYDTVTVIITATPGGFGMPLIMAVAGFFTLGVVNYVLE